MLNFFANAWVHLYKHRASYPLMMTTNSIALLGAPSLIEQLPFTNEQFQELWALITSNPGAAIVSNDEYQASNGILPNLPPG